MSVAAKQHIVVKDASLLDVIQTVSLRWNGLSAKYYQTVDQLIKMRPFGMSWILLHLENDPSAMRAELSRISISPDWRDIDWLLFTHPAFEKDAHDFQDEYQQIKEVLTVPCSRDVLGDVYTKLLDPSAPYRAPRASRREMIAASIAQEIQAPKEETRKEESEIVLPPPQFPSAIPPKRTAVPTFVPSQFTSPTMPPPPRMEPFTKRAAKPSFEPSTGQPKPSSPAPERDDLAQTPSQSLNGEASAFVPVSPTSVEPEAILPPPAMPAEEAEQLPSQPPPKPLTQTAGLSSTKSLKTSKNPTKSFRSPMSVTETRTVSIDERLVEFFKIHPSITDFAILDSEAVQLQASSEKAEIFAKECEQAMDIAGNIGAKFGLGSTVEIHPMGRAKCGAYFSVNPNPTTFDDFRVVVLLGRRGSNTVNLAVHLRKNI